MKAHQILTVLATTATALAAGLLTAPAAHATVLSCGDTVTTDVTLTRDLTCSGTALHVQVPEGGTVHVDLGGHTISGDGTGTGIEAGTVDYGRNGSLVVRAGTIRGFRTALLRDLQPADHLGLIRDLSLDRVELRDNGTWVPPWMIRRLDVTRSRIIGSGVGSMSTETTLTVRQSLFLHSSIDGGSESYNYLYDNVFVDATFTHGTASNVVATGNLFRSCDVAISIPDVWSASRTTIENNVFDSCRVGVSLRAPGGGTISVRRNTFLHNSGDGFTFNVYLVGAMTVEGNRFLGNGGNGMSGTGNPAVVIRGNVAIGNGGHGIDVTKVVDGGRNVAIGNHTSPQCTGVICTP